MNRKGMVASNIGVGIVVAADVPPEYLTELQNGNLVPVQLVFVRGTDRHGDPIKMPVRDLVSEEIIGVVNRAIAEGKIEFGFRKPVGDGGPIRLA